MWRNRFTTACLIAFWLLTPDVLCLLPGVDLTTDEHDCCERMAGQCGRTPMPEFHKCCQTVKRAEILPTSKTTQYPEPESATLPFIVPAPDLVYVAVQPLHWLRFESPTPPPLIPQDSIDILRI